MSIEDKLRRYFRSEKFQKKCDETVKRYNAEGYNKTNSGSELANDKTFAEMTAAMAGFIEARAAKDGVPDSVLRNIRSLRFFQSKLTGDNRWHEVKMFFDSDYSRPSLYEDGYDGIDNIIALFNNGYVARQSVYGAWDGHKPTGESIFHSYTAENSPHIPSKIGRPTLEFMQKAVHDFNAEYGEKYKIKVVLGDVYSPSNMISELK